MAGTGTVLISQISRARWASSQGVFYIEIVLSTWKYTALRVFQIVIAVSSSYWTDEVEAAISQTNGLDEYLTQSNEQINKIVELVRGKLDKGVRLTLGALVVIDVHGERIILLSYSLSIDKKWPMCSGVFGKRRRSCCSLTCLRE